ncbi:MAG: hypothetical protein ACR2G7_10910 [Acidimicrobiales bacterium]
MTPEEVEWSQEVSQADWIVQRLHDFAVDVGSVIPDGLPAYVRIEHGDARAGGSLSPEETVALVSLLAPVTAPDRCWFCLWEGFGWIRGGRAMVRLERPSRLRRGLRRLRLVGLCWDPAGSPMGAVPPDVLAGPHVELPHRSYLLYRGPVATATAWLGHPYRQSPNLWWAADRTWVVASEIDLDWTCVGGPVALIRRILDHPLLDASPASPTDRLVATTNGRGR